MQKLSLLLLLLPLTFAASYNDRYQDYSRDYYGQDDPKVVTYPRPVTHTFPNRTQCAELCELPCTVTQVYMNVHATEMFNCVKLRPPKVTLFSSLKQNSFYMTLMVLGIIVAAILLLLTLCFCCSYCCRQPVVTSRGSSKDALNPSDDGEFREYLNTEEIGATKRDREFARRTPRVQMV